MTEELAGAKLRAVGKDGRSSRIKADYIEVDFGEAGRFLISVPRDGDAVLDVIAEVDGGEARLNVLPDAVNAVRLQLAHAEPAMVPDTATAGEGADEAAEVGAQQAPLLTLTVQRALESADKVLAPRKHRIRRWARAALRQGGAEVTVRLVGEEEGRTLNREYRGKDYATNVLTFVYGDENAAAHADGNMLWGDLVLCVPVVVREALAQGKSPDAHFAHLVVHGMLHLQGFDHEAGEDAEVMERLEKEILDTLGYADPYA